jgi:hypothetical protein
MITVKLRCNTTVRSPQFVAGMSKMTVNRHTEQYGLKTFMAAVMVALHGWMSVWELDCVTSNNLSIKNVIIKTF